MEPDRIKENLVIVAGMSRAGTTFLYHNLQKHPQLFLPARKEIGYFALHYPMGEAWYLQFFEAAAGGQIPVDICGLYFTDRSAVERIRAFNPDQKIILGVRDPVDWAYSLYQQYRGNYQMPDFISFLNGCTVQRQGAQMRLDFTDNGVKARLLDYIKTFRDSILLYDFAVLEKDPLGLLRSIESFAGVAQYYAPDNFTNRRINARQRRRIPFLDRALQSRWLVPAIVKLFPRRAILTLRGWLDKGVAPADQHRPSAAEAFTPAQQEAAEAHFARDRAFVQQLFAQKPIVTGRDLEDRIGE